MLLNAIEFIEQSMHIWFYVREQKEHLPSFTLKFLSWGGSLVSMAFSTTSEWIQKNIKCLNFVRLRSVGTVRGGWSNSEHTLTIGDFPFWLTCCLNHFLCFIECCIQLLISNYLFIISISILILMVCDCNWLTGER